MTRTAIRLEGISKSFGTHNVLQSIDFSVTEGTIMGLIGKNGAGKSTMIKCLLGLLRPDDGIAKVFEEPSWNLSVECKERIGYVPQTPVGFRWMTVESLLAYTGSFYSHWNKQKVAHLIREWDLDAYTKVGSLSEGERQKVAIIQAMGHEPDLYILDEPVASLDPVARRRFIRQLIELNSNADKTVLFSTHITSDLERVAADIALLKAGGICFRGDLSTLKDRIVRLRVQARETLPSPLPFDNVIRSDINLTSAVVTVDGFDVGEIPKISREISAVITVEHLNLEEIFLELNK